MIRNNYLPGYLLKYLYGELVEGCLLWLHRISTSMATRLSRRTCLAVDNRPCSWLCDCRCRLNDTLHPRLAMELGNSQQNIVKHSGRLTTKQNAPLHSYLVGIVGISDSVGCHWRWNSPSSPYYSATSFMCRVSLAMELGRHSRHRTTKLIALGMRR